MAERRFGSLSLSGWRQFRRVDLRFSPSVTVLTGRNGTGKTSILTLLGQHSAYPSSFLSLPRRDRSGPGIAFLPGIWTGIRRLFAVESPSENAVGSIQYSDGIRGDIVIPDNVGIEYSPQIRNQQPLRVLNIPSHRRLPTYRRIDQIPTVPIRFEVALQNYQQDFWSHLRGGHTQFTPLSRMKEALVSMALLGPGNNIVRPDAESLNLFRDFEENLRRILPKNIGFQRIIIEMPDVILDTKSGRFLIDASSGGLMSLIDLTWQLTLFGREQREFTVVMDEPENHLHPSMQREFLPAITSAFPDIQLIVATHSPFIVSSVKDAYVYAFDIEEIDGLTRSSDDLSGVQNAVVTVPVDLSNRTSTSEILKKVLGVPVDVPIWAERELEEVLAEFAGQGLTVQSVRAIYLALQARGLAELLPDVVGGARLGRCESLRKGTSLRF